MGSLPVLLRRLCRLSGLRKVHVSRNRDTDVENEHVDTGPVGKGGMNWESSTDIYTGTIDS